MVTFMRTKAFLLRRGEVGFLLHQDGTPIDFITDRPYVLVEAGRALDLLGARLGL